MKIVLAGNPNVGKSLLFSRITRIGIVTANYSGTTVETKSGSFIFQGRDYDLIDGPGIYSLDKFSKTDQIALKVIDEGDIIINVIDATNLERNLNLTLELIKMRKPMVVCLNFWEDTVHKGIKIDVQKLEQLLDIPVVTVSSLRNEGIPELLATIENARASRLEIEPDKHWNYIGSIISNVQQLQHRHHTLLERISDFTLHPVGGIISAVFVLFSTLFIVRYMGESIINYLFEPFYTKIYDPFIHDIVNAIPFDIVRVLLTGESADPLQSFGILTSGVYIAFIQVFPYFFSFYFVFGFLEDFGYLPRLAVVLDRLFHKLGLHGYSSIPVMLGLGCKVPAFMATRGLTNKREKILTIALVFMSVPCLSQSAMIVSLGMHYGILTVVSIYVILAAAALGFNYVMNKMYKKGDTPEFFAEFPSCRVPSVKLLARKLKIRVVEYFIEVLPMIAVGVLMMNILNALHVLSFITDLIKVPVNWLLGLPSDIAPVMLMNFLRKDASVALLVPLKLNAYQFIIACVFLVLSTPCIASFFTMIKELGMRTALKIMGVIFLLTIVVTSLLHLLFSAFS
ncbi:MAG TPA: ferrous iron transporter B [Clostridia bacterium]|nr:ferrous iron transporter B [Clostridia bacterium]